MAGWPRRNASVTTKTRSARKNCSNFCTASCRRSSLHLWGKFDETEDRVVAHGSDGEGDADLLDYTALMTLRQG
jgi:hypothetical protein